MKSSSRHWRRRPPPAGPVTGARRRGDGAGSTASPCCARSVLPARTSALIRVRAPPPALAPRPCPRPRRQILCPSTTGSHAARVTHAATSFARSRRCRVARRHLRHGHLR
ncbi:hypothetical protein BS78_K182800 [Paspalum vaginatum]|uniref:Uncharacterized protein n=1 Tax=Paspalum vaginatum TaxID=158149 RepID=A0A9W7XF80_9POAL|nr:hypothetical protein BS78_K182800 [Paspalum vaginatum]